MVTVATSLDVPIKLVFPGPVRSSILGLGDIVIPGIVIALAKGEDVVVNGVIVGGCVVVAHPEGVVDDRIVLDGAIGAALDDAVVVAENKVVRNRHVVG